MHDIIHTKTYPNVMLPLANMYQMGNWWIRIFLEYLLPTVANF